MILIIATEDDIHALVVGQRLAAMGQEFAIWDPTWFPQKQRISWGSNNSATIRANVTFEISNVECIWRRRIPAPTLDPSLTDLHVRRFAETESRELINGILASHPRVVNNPDMERNARSKIRQLNLARLHGLTIPRTIVSNDVGAIREFLAGERRAVCKTLRNKYPHSILTRECNLSDFEDERTVSFAPIIVQQLIESDADIRIVVVGEEVFAGELNRPDINREVDWRLTPTGWRSHQLPNSVSDNVLGFIRDLGLDTASVDMRRTLGGEYFFLEVNPGGQFLFLEVDADIPLTYAFARHLANANCITRKTTGL